MYDASTAVLMYRSNYKLVLEWCSIEWYITNCCWSGVQLNGTLQIGVEASYIT